MLQGLPRLASALQFARIRLLITTSTYSLCACHHAGTSGRLRVEHNMFQVPLGALCGFAFAALNMFAFVLRSLGDK